MVSLGRVSSRLLDNPVLLPRTAPRGIVEALSYFTDGRTQQLGHLSFNSSPPTPPASSKGPGHPDAFGPDQFMMQIAGVPKDCPPTLHKGMICSDFISGNLYWNSRPTEFMDRERAGPGRRRHNKRLCVTLSFDNPSTNEG